MLAATHNLDDLVEDLDVRGYALIRTAADFAALTAAAELFGAHVGSASMGARLLEAQDSPDWLPRHTEQLDDVEPLQYFALGCLEPAMSGGATCLYDGRLAASALADAHPELVKVQITYATRWRPTIATHPLIVFDRDHGPVLRYRSALETNRVDGPLPPGMTEAQMYGLIEAAVSEAVAVVHRWRPGDLLIVNNRVMIHARQPFVGTRRMVRYRFDDPHFKTAIIGR